jgi:predicted nucleic acid-binding protein
MQDRVFVDTNILIYAHDLDSGTKNKKASRLLFNLWEAGTGILSIQVLQEFYVNITRKIPSPLSKSTARGIISNYSAWHVELNNPQTLLHASEIEERYQLSFWDSLIIASAYQSGADKILTEDLNHGQSIEGIVIENPFIQV